MFVVEYQLRYIIVYNYHFALYSIALYSNMFISDVWVEPTSRHIRSVHCNRRKYYCAWPEISL